MRFYPKDYNQKANPSLSKTNSPWPFFAAFMLVAGIGAALYFLFPPAVRISQPALDFSQGKVTAISKVSNNTNNSLTLTIRFDIGFAYSGTRSHPAYYQSLGQREIVAHVDAHSSRSVSCEFSMPQQLVPNSAAAKIIHRR